MVKNERGAFAIRYAGIDQANMVTQYYRLNKARNFAEWRAAMAGQGVPATNFIYADARGNIGFFYNAMFPDRQPGFNWRGVLPGDTSADLWTKALPFDRVPALVNPRSGYVMNANNTPWVAAGPGDELDAAAFSPLLGIEDDMTNRATRLIELFEASGQIDEVRPKAGGGHYKDQIAFVKDRPGHDRRYAIDARKLERELGWKPEETFETGIRKTIEWYLQNQDWVRNVTSGAYREWVGKQYEVGL